ncbi:acetoacetate metabolism regulatory protein AtoC [Planctomycetota bacterium]|nr:acetoacetate metabolism regulatory protein AtoC [Planctomycetota bacterium]
MARVLVVDDEPGVRAMLAVILRRDGHEVSIAGDGAEALAMAARPPAPEVVLSDLRMAGVDGLALLERIRHPANIPGGEPPFVVLMTAFAEWDTAVRAMRLGAYDLLRKPFDNQQARAVVARAAAARERHQAARTAGEHHAAIQIIGSSKPVQELHRLIEQVSTTDSTVLVTGESGTGKELVARAVHYASLRAEGPMMRINSGALAPSLLESELFGHVKGAFTGAIEDRPGLFALADKGTIFLDEVGDLAMETQVKLLRILESGEYLPVGGREVRTCDVRVVAATNRDLSAMVQAGTFREDLFYRLAVIPVHLPPLRERREDIPLLAGHLLSRHAVKLRRGVGGFTREAIDAMQAHPWPGNIRELDNRIQRGVALTPLGDIAAKSLFGEPAQTRTSSSMIPTAGGALMVRISKGEPINLDAEVANLERDLISAALKKTGDNYTEAANLLGISLRQIRYKVRQLGVR